MLWGESPQDHVGEIPTEDRGFSLSVSALGCEMLLSAPQTEPWQRVGSREGGHPA